MQSFAPSHHRNKHRKGYHTGYCDGYDRGTLDAQAELCTSSTPPELLDRPIETMGLSVGTYNCLHFANLHSIRDVVELREEQICVIRNLGKKRAAEIAKNIQNMGLMHTPWDKYLF